MEEKNWNVPRRGKVSLGCEGVEVAGGCSRCGGGGEWRGYSGEGSAHGEWRGWRKQRRVGKALGKYVLGGGGMETAGLAHEIDDEGGQRLESSLGKKEEGGREHAGAGREGSSCEKLWDLCY